MIQMVGLLAEKNKMIKMKKTKAKKIKIKDHYKVR